LRAIAVREDVRDLILDAADRLLARYGYKKMTMDDLAQEVGIGKGTVYLHFDSKEEVALSHIDRIVERLTIQLHEIAQSNETSGNRLRRMLVARVLFRFDSVQHYTQSISDLLVAIRPALLTRRQGHFEHEAQIFTGVLKEGRRAGELTFKDATATAHTLLLATNSLLPYSLSTRELGVREEVEHKVAHLAHLLLDGLRSRSDTLELSNVRSKPKKSIR
jgi:AcrR family transcriptional regulator